MSDARPTSEASLAAEAAEWYTRLRAPDVSEIEAVRFRAWLAGDPARRLEFEAVDAFWEDLGALEHSAEVARVRAQIAGRGRPSTRRGRYLAVAAAVAIAVGAAWTIKQSRGADRYVTDIGEQRMVPLADGSVVTLNTSTEIRLRYSDSMRRVELVSGQAVFEVAKDTHRPFVVSADGAVVRALGTVFDVYKSGDKVTVTLIEGKVAVKPKDPPPATDHLLSPGDQLSFSTVGDRSRRAEVVKLASSDVPRVTAWRTRKLDFSDTPLLEAIAEANRYSRDQVILHAPDLARARISGTFEAGKNDAFVEGLQTYFRLRVEKAGGHKIVLTSSAGQD